MAIGTGWGAWLNLTQQKPWKATGKLIYPGQQYINKTGVIVRYSDANGREFIEVESDDD